jgi:repressor LexA
MEPQIKNKDIVIVHRQDTADPGDIVIATINGDDAVCKKFMIYGNTVLLRSFNPDYDDIDVTGHTDFKIWGRVIEARHRF